jgi:capsular exopolysaccharide synthesis family protein
MGQYFKNDSINLSFLFSRILSHWYYFVVIAPIILSLAFIYVRGADRIFAYQGSIDVGPTRTGAQTSEEMLDMMQGGGGDYRKRTTENETIIMSSFGLVREAVSKLDFGVSYFYSKNFKKVELYKISPFIVKVDSTSAQIVGVKMTVEKISDTQYKLSFEGDNKDLYVPSLQKFTGAKWFGKFEKTLNFGVPYRSKELNITISLVPNSGMDTSAEYYFYLHTLDELAASYKGRLKVKELVTNANILEVRTEGTTGGKEMTFIDTLMHTFIKHELDKKNMTAVKTLGFVNQQFEESAKDLVTAQQQFKAYTSNKKLVHIINQSGIVFGNIDKLTKEKSDLEVRIANYKDILAIIDDDKAMTNVRQPTVLTMNDNTFYNLLGDLNEAYQERAKLEITAKEKSIALQEVNMRISVLKQTMKDYVMNTIKELSTISLKDLEARIKDSQSTLDELPESNSVLLELERRVDFHKKRYEFFLSKKQEAEINLASSSPDSKIIDYARDMGNIAPNTRFIYFMSILVSALVPIGLIIAKDVINDKVRNQEELFEATKIPLIATIAKGDKKTKVILKDKPHSLIAETFRTLRTNLDYLGDQQGKMIAITSSTATEGKTFCSVNLSTAFAVAGRKTLLVCADLRRSSIKNYFNLQPEGMTEYLSDSNNVPLQFFIQKTEIPNLDIISAGKHTSIPSELLSSERMNSFIEEIKAKYDKIVIDTPPISFVADYFTINHFVDMTLYVVRTSFTKVNSLEPINEMYEKSKIKNIRIVINDYKYPSSFENSYIKGGYATTATATA